MHRLPLSLFAILSATAAPALANEAAPVTQSTDKGSYWVLNQELANDEGSIPASYTRVENLCITTDGRRFFGIQPASGKRPVMARTEGGPLPIVLTPVDAGAGTRHFRIGNPEREDEYLTLNFIAPGMREQDLPSATAGLSSVTAGEEYQIDCIEGDRIVMMATDGSNAMIVTSEEGELVLRGAPQSDQPEIEYRSGFLAQDDQFNALHFVNGGGSVTLELSRDGTVDGYGVSVEEDGIVQFREVDAYFIADPDVLTQYTTEASRTVGALISRLSLCNHFAGETGDDPDRNAQIAVKWDELGCAAVPAQYASVLAAEPEGSGLKAYLEANSPNWM